MFDDDLIALASHLGELLREKKQVLTLAESCTGGLISALVTEVSGSSTWFDRSFVTYSNAAKMQMLGVSQHSLTLHGAVSELIATEMAIGALANSSASLAGAVTGVAGPSGGTALKPVGMVCFALAMKQNHLPAISASHYLHGDRHQIRKQSAAIMLQMLIDFCELT